MAQATTRAIVINVIDSGVRYMFEPKRVRDLLVDLPALAAALGDPSAEGVEAVHFPGARTTPRQFYRLLAAAHMQHIKGFLRRVEFAYEHGWRDNQFLGTSSRAQMRGGTAETLVVESLLLSGFDIAPVERGSGRSPDIAASRGDLHALVEVYTPRTWEGLFDFVEDAKDWFVHLDEPYDYNFNFEMRHLQLFDERGFARWFDAFEFSLSAERQFERLMRLAPVLAEARERLAWGIPAFEAERSDDELDIQVTATLSSIRPREYELPARNGFLSPPALSGYAPEGIFENMLAKGLRKKLERRQANPGKGETAVLVTDISHLQIQSEIDDDGYRRRFEDALNRRIDAATMPYDLLLFVLPGRQQGERFRVVFAVTKKGSGGARELAGLVR